MASKRFEFIPSYLNTSNDLSFGSLSDPVSGQLVPGGGLLLGDYFDITDNEAAQFSGPSAGQLYGGRYRRIRVDAGATAANVKVGTLAFLTTLAKGVSVVTDYSHALATSMCVGVFLNSPTPGNYSFIQQTGTATVLGGAAFTGTPAIGGIIGVSTTTAGAVDVPTSATAVTATTVGVAIDLPVVATLFRSQLKDLFVSQG